MRKTFGFLLAFSALFAASVSASVPEKKGYDAKVPDSRLSDPDEFGRFADVSRAHPDAVTTPRFGSYRSPGSSTPGLTPAATPFARAAQQAIPAPAAAAERGEEKRPAARTIGLIALGAASIAGLGLLLLARRGSRQPAEPVLPAPLETPAEIDFPEELAPIRPWVEPEQHAVPDPAPVSTPTPRPDSVYFEPELKQSWLAITAAEQAAIERWDNSPEKELGLSSLEQWLDDHAANLKNIDVRRLKAKLHRDV